MKAGIKILHVSKKGSRYTIKEMEVNTLLTLNNHKEFESGDNSNVIATDSQKNTVYILAKKFGITNPEEFGLLIANHFISMYSKVATAKVSIIAEPWQRFTDLAGKPHDHVFVSHPKSTRVASISVSRGKQPMISSGIRNLRVLKTTQSSFTNFVSDEYRSLPDNDDRLLSTIMTADWTYNNDVNRKIDFDESWHKVQESILETFAGTFSSSVQNTQYLTEKSILERLPEVEKISMTMPDVHYYGFDFSKFQQISGLNETMSRDVYVPVENPSGQIQLTLSRGKKERNLSDTKREEMNSRQPIPLERIKSHKKIEEIGKIQIINRCKKNLSIIEKHTKLKYVCKSSLKNI